MRVEHRRTTTRGGCLRRTRARRPTRIRRPSCPRYLSERRRQDADVLTNDHVVHAGQFGRLGMVPGVLDGGRCLPERHADRHVVHRKLEPHDVLDDDLVPIKIVLILEEQLQGLGLLIGLLGGLLDDRVGHVVVTVGVGKHLFVTKNQVANDFVDDAGADVVGQRSFISVIWRCKVSSGLIFLVKYCFLSALDISC
uniref:Uncharacterized protein n=1 Tax=Hyaloperonospora arabidopsidis (strain Emoy2) TaxID=559515 RepID=M4BX46_HYAAE